MIPSIELSTFCWILLLGAKKGFSFFIVYRYTFSFDNLLCLILKRRCAHECFLHIFTIQLKNLTPIFFDQLICETMKNTKDHFSKMKILVFEVEIWNTTLEMKKIRLANLINRSC